VDVSLEFLALLRMATGKCVCPAQAADDDDILSDEEVKLLEQCHKDIKEHPENFTPREQVRRKS